MRLTADDPGARDAKVFLNGRDVSDRCFEADDEAGFVRLACIGYEGKPYDDPATGDIAEETVHGRVCIEIGK